MAECSKEITWARQLLHELRSQQVTSTIMYCDNQGAIKLVENPVLHRRTKHIDVRYHFIRDAKENGIIDVIISQAKIKQQTL